MHHLWFILICIVWGSSFILMKYAAAAFGPVSIGAGRVVGGALVLFVIWLFVRRRSGWSIRRRDLPGLLLVVGLGCCWPFVIQPHLIGKYQDSAFFGMIVALVPLMTIVISIPMLGLRPTARQLVGVVIGLVCLAILMGVGAAKQIAVGDLLLAASSPLAYTISNTYMKRRFQEHSPLELTMSALLLSAVVLVPLGFGREPIDTGDEGFGVAVLCVALLGVFGSGLAWFLFFTLVQQRGPLFAGMVTYVVPIGALVWGWVDGETIAMGQVAALVGVFGAVALVQTEGVVAGRAEAGVSVAGAVADPADGD